MRIPESKPSPEDVEFMDQLVVVSDAEFFTAMHSDGTPIDWDGPWYLEGKLGYELDVAEATDIERRVWSKLKLEDFLSSWASARHCLAVHEVIESTVFSGIHLGRIVAGQLIDREKD